MSRDDELGPETESPAGTMLGQAVVIAVGCLALIIILVVLVMAAFVYVL